MCSPAKIATAATVRLHASRCVLRDRMHSKPSLLVRQRRGRRDGAKRLWKDSRHHLGRNSSALFSCRDAGLGRDAQSRPRHCRPYPTAPSDASSERHSSATDRNGVWLPCHHRRLIQIRRVEADQPIEARHRRIRLATKLLRARHPRRVVIRNNLAVHSRQPGQMAGRPRKPSQHKGDACVAPTEGRVKITPACASQWPRLTQHTATPTSQSRTTAFAGAPTHQRP